EFGELLQLSPRRIVDAGGLRESLPSVNHPMANGRHLAQFAKRRIRVIAGEAIDDVVDGGRVVPQLHRSPGRLASGDLEADGCLAADGLNLSARDAAVGILGDGLAVGVDEL